MKSSSWRRYPVGAERNPAGGVEVRVWAPKRSKVEVVFDGGAGAVVLEREEGGYFRGTGPEDAMKRGYKLRLDGGDRLFPDPASRAQPDGPHGWSRFVDPTSFRWTDSDWRGLSPEGQVLYELHLGTFTPAGTWAAAEAELPELARLGVTVLEIMPIAEFPGRFGWGYDGVDFFAPTRLYGSPDDARRFVDRAHALGLGVILDVVYNHFGPDGNYVAELSDTWFTTKHKTDWGAALNYDGEGSAGVRDFITANAAYWVDEFHFDGLRLDATQNIYDDSSPHILSAITDAVRRAARGRGTIVIGENESQHGRLARPAAKGGYGLDALWNDDFHHTALVALTGRREAYYTDYGGTPQELISSLKRGFLYQGQHYVWQKQRRGQPALDLRPTSFVSFLENHDQVANSARGQRLSRMVSPARHRAMVALMLLGPQTPLLFQGEEFGSSRPFLFFADHGADLGELVRKGRREFLEQFPSVTGALSDALAVPGAPGTFEACKLDLSERETHRETYALYRDLLRLRREDGVVGQTHAADPGGLDGAVLASHAFVLRFFGKAPGDDRLLLVNLGPDKDLSRAPEPLLAPGERGLWTVAWSSEDFAYGGNGHPPLEHDGIWHLPAEAALLLRPGSSS